VSSSTAARSDRLTIGKRVLVVSKLSSMSRRDVERLIRERGGQLVERGGEPADLIIVGDEVSDLKGVASDPATIDDATRSALERGDSELLRESEFWARLGLVDLGEGVERLYTPAMLAGLVGVPISAIRHWSRRGALRATREVRRLPYFDFEEVGVARKLAQLVGAGCSMSVINRKLDELARLLPELARPLADPAIVVEGRSVRVRREEGIAEPSGQLLIDFEEAEPGASGDEGRSGPVAIPIAAAAFRSTSTGDEFFAADDLRSLAADLEQHGHRDQAIEAYRAVLVSGDFTADDHFSLAELLYREGDLSAARERYYMAIEIDEDFVEARSNLGCVLAEQGELELAEAAFLGALKYHPNYADAHYHLARLLDRKDQSGAALRHWQRFMDLAPASPWADEARERVGGRGVVE
jgi:Tfp pilus assembly protein PilF